MAELTVAVGGLGAIGLPVARALDEGAVPGLRLVAVSANRRALAEEKLAGFARPPELCALEDLASADVVVECVPAAEFARIAEPAIAAGRRFLALSVGALLPRMDLVERARETGARIIVPSGALLGLDGVRAAAEGTLAEVRLITRKPPGGLAGSPYVETHGIALSEIAEPTCIFSGTAREAARGFPANINVAVALSLAGLGPDRTMVEIWADPTVERNTHEVVVDGDASRFRLLIEGVPSPDNPRTGRLTPLSVLSTLRGLTAPLHIGG